LFLQFEEIHDELSGKFEHILALNHMGVLIRLAEGCVKHGAKQKKFVKVSIVERNYHYTGYRDFHIHMEAL
jgi:hypothetical protein